MLPQSRSNLPGRVIVPKSILDAANSACMELLRVPVIAPKSYEVNMSVTGIMVFIDRVELNAVTSMSLTLVVDPGAAVPAIVIC
jgi:hypothetical protein